MRKSKHKVNMRRALNNLTDTHLCCLLEHVDQGTLILCQGEWMTFSRTGAG